MYVLIVLLGAAVYHLVYRVLIRAGSDHISPVHPSSINPSNGLLIWIDCVHQHSLLIHKQRTKDDKHDEFLARWHMHKHTVCDESEQSFCYLKRGLCVSLKYWTTGHSSVCSHAWIPVDTMLNLYLHLSRKMWYAWETGERTLLAHVISMIKNLVWFCLRTWCAFHLTMQW